MEENQTTITQDNDLIEKTVAKLVETQDKLINHLNQLQDFTRTKLNLIQNPKAKIILNKNQSSLLKAQNELIKANENLIKANNIGKIYTPESENQDSEDGPQPETPNKDELD